MNLIGKEFFTETKEGVGIYITPIEYRSNDGYYLCQRIRDDLTLLFDVYLKKRRSSEIRRSLKEGDFIEKCETGYNSITIINMDEDEGYYYESLSDIPAELYDYDIIAFDSGFGYDKIRGFIFGLWIQL